MPRVNIPVTAGTVTGTVLPAVTAGDAVNNMVFVNSGREQFIATNTGATPRDVTLKFAKTVQGQSVTSIVKTLAASQAVLFGPFPVEDFGTLMQVDVAHAEVTFRGIV